MSKSLRPEKRCTECNARINQAARPKAEVCSVRCRVRKYRRLAAEKKAAKGKASKKSRLVKPA